MKVLSGLRPHPRLFAGRAELDRVRQPVTIPFLQEAERRVATLAAKSVKSTQFDYDPHTHNAHLIRARIMQQRVVTLLVRWFQTGKRRFRDAGVAHVAEMGRWEFWSWITWRQNNPDPGAIFDLSYGENATTLAIAYDWLFDTLSDAERKLFLGIARRRALQPFLARTQPRQAMWWFGSPDCNWNSVCAGGAGMLALAMFEELPESREVLQRAEKSLAPFMHTLDTLDGGWPEGIGYWNYGMRYAFLYLLSHERATGRRHPLLKSRGAAATLSFPLDFCPNGVPSSFGDVNSWSPLPFHYAAAHRLRRPEVIRALDAHLDRQGLSDQESWPNSAELLLIHPRQRAKARAARESVVKLYRGLDWGILADCLPEPRRYLSLRGGTTETPHAHRDLLSFHCVLGDESLITSLNVGEYLDTTFSPRRWEVFDFMPASKNTILINGVGITKPAAVKTGAVRLGDAEGFLLEATEALGRCGDVSMARGCSRLVLFVKQRAFLVVDQVQLPHPGRVESRMHTFATVRAGRNVAVLRGRKESLRVVYAADVPAVFCTAVGAPTTPGRGATILRWCTKKLHTSMILVTLLSPGSGRAGVQLSERNGRQTVTGRGDGFSFRIPLLRIQGSPGRPAK